MKVIVKKEDKDLGKKGKVINVSDGYAFNNLIPAGKVVLATDKNLAKIEQEKVKEQEELAKKREVMQEEAKKLNKKKITIVSRAEGDKLFGSVDKKQIADAIKEQQKIEVTEEMIVLNEPIKKLTTMEIVIDYGNDVKAGVILTISSK